MPAARLAGPCHGTPPGASNASLAQFARGRPQTLARASRTGRCFLRWGGWLRALLPQECRRALAFGAHAEGKHALALAHDLRARSPSALPTFRRSPFLFPMLLHWSLSRSLPLFQSALARQRLLTARRSLSACSHFRFGAPRAKTTDASAFSNRVHVPQACREEAGGLARRGNGLGKLHLEKAACFRRRHVRPAGDRWSRGGQKAAGGRRPWRRPRHRPGPWHEGNPFITKGHILTIKGTPLFD